MQKNWYVIRILALQVLMQEVIRYGLKISTLILSDMRQGIVQEKI
jgi:hypothetical protein